MKFCIEYDKKNKYLKETQQIFVYRTIVPIEKLLDFLEEYKEKEVFYIDNSMSPYYNTLDTDIRIYALAAAKYENFVLSIDYYLISNYSKMLQENGIKYMPDIPVDNAYDLKQFIELQVSALIVGGDLRFNIPKVSLLLKQNNIKLIMAIKDTDIVITEDNLSDYLKLRNFYIRPDDIDLYGVYVDSFIIHDPMNNKKDEVLYEIYVKDKKYFGLLNEIIPELPSNIDNRAIIPTFGEKRIKCGRRCLLNPRSCNLCSEIIELSNHYKKLGILIEKK